GCQVPPVASQAVWSSPPALVEPESPSSVVIEVVLGSAPVVIAVVAGPESGSDAVVPVSPADIGLDVAPSSPGGAVMPESEPESEPASPTESVSSPMSLVSMQPATRVAASP